MEAENSNSSINCNNTEKNSTDKIENIKSKSHKIHPVQKYFNFNAETKKSICKVEKCKYPMNGNHSNNLKRHISRKHKDLIKQLEEELKQSNEVNEKTETKKVRLFIDPTEISKGLLELVTVNCRPYSILNDSGFLRIFHPISEALYQAKMPVSLNRTTIQDQTKEIEIRIKNDINNEMNDSKLISLQMDLTSIYNRTVLGVNAQYMKNNQLCVRAIAMKVINDTTGVNIALVTRNILEEYGKSIDDVYSITTDNGKNVLKCVDTLKVFQEHVLDDYMSGNPEEIDMETLRTLVENQADRLSNGLDSFFLFGIRCCAHTLELALKDACESIVETVINPIQSYVTKIRTPTICKLLEEQGLKKPSLACDTRWNSKYEMVNIFLIFMVLC